jgi:hypothetical protein
MKTMRGGYKNHCNHCFFTGSKEEEEEEGGGKKECNGHFLQFFGGYFNYSLVLKIIRYVQYRLQPFDNVEKGGGIPRFKFLPS